jgi:hypothetical protein
MTCLPIGMRCSSSCVCGSLITMQRLPRTLAAEVHDAVDLGDLGGVLGRRASNSSATRGRPPVMSLVLDSYGASWPCRVPATILVAFVHDDVRARRNRVAGEAPVVIGDDDLRVQVFLVLDDDHGFLAGGLVHLLLHRHAFDDVVELHGLPAFSEMNRHVVGIPLDEGASPFLTLPPSSTEMTAPMTRCGSPARGRRRRGW